MSIQRKKEKEPATRRQLSMRARRSIPICIPHRRHPNFLSLNQPFIIIMTSTETGSLLARIYKSTIHRVPAELASLNRHAGFVLIDPSRNRTYVWIGTMCTEGDKRLAESFAFDVVREDFKNEGIIENIIESKEPEAALSEMLEALFTHKGTYLETAASRSSVIQNTGVLLYLVERKKTKGDRELVLKPICRVNVGRTGEVAKMPFLKSVTGKTCIVISEGIVWTVWIGDLISRRQQAEIRSFVAKAVLEKIPPETKEERSLVFHKNLVVLTKSANLLFRSHFKPESLKGFLSYQKKAISRGTSTQMPHSGEESRIGQSAKVEDANPDIDMQADISIDCVTDTFLRLFELSAYVQPPSQTQDDVIDTRAGAEKQSTGTAGTSKRKDNAQGLGQAVNEEIASSREKSSSSDVTENRFSLAELLGIDVERNRTISDIFNPRGRVGALDDVVGKQYANSTMQRM